MLERKAREDCRMSANRQPTAGGGDLPSGRDRHQRQARPVVVQYDSGLPSQLPAVGELGATALGRFKKTAHCGPHTY